MTLHSNAIDKDIFLCSKQSSFGQLYRLQYNLKFIAVLSKKKLKGETLSELQHISMDSRLKGGRVTLSSLALSKPSHVTPHSNVGLASV